MDTTDFTGLAARAVAGLDEVRACLLASRDGLTLAALPEGREEIARRALDRLETVGQPDRGFLVIGEEVWVVARRGPYVGIVVALASAKAGLLLDRLESTLRAAEESRLLAGSAGTVRPEAPRRPRTPLHREKPEPTRPEVKPPDPVFEQVARVVSVPEQEARAAEASVTEAPVAPSFPRVIPEPAAPEVGGPGSEPEPPAIVHPQPPPEEPKVTAPEPEEPNVVAPQAEPEVDLGAPEPDRKEPEVVAPEPQLEEPVETLQPQPEETVETLQPQPEEHTVVASEPQPDERKVVASEPQPEEPNTVPMEPEPAAANVVPEPQAVEIMTQQPKLEEHAGKEEPPTAVPHRADEIPAASASAPAPAPEVRQPQRLANPEVQPPKPTPHYSPPDALLGEMGRVVAEETPPADIYPPGVSAPEPPVVPSDTAGEDANVPPGAKKPEASKERAEGTEVDPVALAREFSQLFDEPERDS